MGLNEIENQKKLKEFKQKQKNMENSVVVNSLFSQDDDDKNYQ